MDDFSIPTSLTPSISKAFTQIAKSTSGLTESIKALSESFRKQDELVKASIANIQIPVIPKGTIEALNKQMEFFDSPGMLRHLKVSGSRFARKSKELKKAWKLAFGNMAKFEFYCKNCTLEQLELMVNNRLEFLEKRSKEGTSGSPISASIERINLVGQYRSHVNDQSGLIRYLRSIIQKSLSFSEEDRFKSFLSSHNFSSSLA